MGLFSKLIDKQLAAYQRELIETHYREVDNMYRQIRGWRHDYRNHIQTMKAYAAAGDWEAIRRYLDLLDEDLTTVDTVIKTGNAMTDAILNSKISLARSKGIQVTADAHIPVRLKTGEIDLCCIIGNLFDNAIDASMQLPESQRLIRVYMDMKNTGIEFEISADLIKTPNVLWTVSVNGTHYKNEITKLPSDQPQDGYNSGTYWRELGGSLYDFYLPEFAGVDSSTGEALYNVYTESGNKGELTGTTTSATNATNRATGKSAIPDIYGGFSTFLSVYGFDFSAAFAYQLGGWTLDSNYASLMGGGTAGTNWHKDIYDRWTPQNTDSQIPRLDNGNLNANQTSTRFLTRASYLSLRNLTIGYTFPKRIAEKIAMQNLRIFLTGDNLWYISARKGLDVRQSFSGETGFTYSALRTVSAGISLTF